MRDFRCRRARRRDRGRARRHLRGRERRQEAVALVEAGLLGGESPYLACLPSNSLLLSAARGETWEDAVARRDEVTGGLDDSARRAGWPRRASTVIRGTGRITGPGTVEVTLAPAQTGGRLVLLLGSGHRDRLRAGRAADRGPVRHTGLDHRAEPVLARPAPAAHRARRRARRMRAHADLRLVRLTGDAGGGGIRAAARANPRSPGRSSPRRCAGPARRSTSAPPPPRRNARRTA